MALSVSSSSPSRALKGLFATNFHFLVPLSFLVGRQSDGRAGVNAVDGTSRKIGPHVLRVVVVLSRRQQLITANALDRVIGRSIVQCYRTSREEASNTNCKAFAWLLLSFAMD